MATAALVLLTLASVLAVVGPDRVRQSEDQPRSSLAMASPAADSSAEMATIAWESQGDPESPFDNPGHLTIDPEGNIWVVDQRRSGFQIIAPDGAFLEFWGTVGTGPGEFDLSADGSPTGAAAFDQHGNLFVADSGNKRIQKFGPDRSFITSWGTEGTGEGQFLEPENLSIDGAGNVYVIDTLRDDVQVFDSSGAYLRTIGSYGTAEGRFMIFFTTGIVVDEVGNLWVADTSNQRVQVFTPQGELERVIGGAAADGANRTFTSPSGVDVDQQGRLFVADTGVSGLRVQALSSEGSVIGYWQERGRDQAELSIANGLTLDSNGNLYVSDHYSDRLLKLQLLPPFGLMP